MQDYTPEQRRLYADRLCELIQEWIVERESAFEIDLERGVEWCINARSGDRTPRANSTFTVSLRINGGAQESEGSPILPSPPVFRGPVG